jgi:ketosteroid isomerase-like protein
MLFAVVALLLAGALAGCRHTPPEQALRETIAGMQAAAEARDTDALFAPIAEDFVGSEGMDRQQFRRYVTFSGMRDQHVGVQLGQLDVKLFGDRATVAFTAALTGGASWLPEHAQVYAVDTGWRLESGKWKLISARWKPQL